MDGKTRLLVGSVAVLFLVILLVTGYRFFFAHAYILEYEAPCDQQTQSCFIYACTEEDDGTCEDWLYVLMRKQAVDVYTACGPDITECESAYVCNESDRFCEIIECDSELEECAPLPDSEEMMNVAL